jgi:hypothetical protein
LGERKARRASQTGADVASFAPRRIVTFLAGPQKIIGGLLVSNLMFSEVVRRGTTHGSYGKSPKESLVAGATLSELHRSAFKLQHLSGTVKPWDIMFVSWNATNMSSQALDSAVR